MVTITADHENAVATHTRLGRVVILAVTAPHPGGAFDTVKIRTTDGTHHWVDAADVTVTLNQ